MEQEYKQQFKEFCDIFKGLNVTQAVAKAEELGLHHGYDEGCELVDIDYKRICVTVYNRDGVGHISPAIEIWNDCGTDYKIVHMEAR